jgi:predicted permease
MRAWFRLLWKLRFGWRRASLDRELEEEMRFHLDMARQEQGGDPRRAFGNATLWKEDSRSVWGFNWFDTLAQDVRFAFRAYRRDWSSTTAAGAALALGIGLATAIFTVVNAVLLQPLPYREPQRLVMVWAVNKQQGWDQEKMSIPEMRDWERSGLFEGIVGFMPNMTSITGPGESELTHGYAVTPGFLPLLGAQPMLGRAFSAEEESKGGNKKLVLLRHSFWMRRFGGDPRVVGQKILVQDEPYTIAGVMGPEFQFFNRQTDLYVPTPWQPSETNFRGRLVRVIARLKDGISLEQAQARANVQAEAFARDHPESNRGWTIQLSPVPVDTTGPVRQALWVLLASVGMVLVIACANVANLLLTQGIARSREIALRIALGAGRMRVFRQLLTESLLLAAISGALGYGLARVAVSYLRGTLPAQYSFGRFLIQMERIQVDGWVALFAAAVAPLVAVLIGVLPAWRASRMDLNDAMKDAARSTSGSSAARRLQNLLVTGELTIALVLAIGAALLAQSFGQLYEQGPGFRPDSINSMYIGLPMYERRIRDNEEFRRVASGMFDRALQSVAAIPGVRAIAAVSHLPLAGFYYLADFTVEGLMTTREDQPHAIDRYVSNTYHEALGVPLRQGRYFNAFDRPGSDRVVLVNEQFARRYLGERGALGRRIRYGVAGAPNPDAWYTIVGVVAGERAGGMEEEPKPMVYVSMDQNPWTYFHLIVKTDMSLGTTVEAVKKELHKISPKIAPYEIRTFDDLVLDSTWRVRYSMMMLIALAGVALALAALGVYGVLSYAVRRRTREIGIRMALGADRPTILYLVARDGMKLALAGIVAGVAGASALAQFLSSLLFGVRAIEPPTYAAVCGFLALVVLGACLVPARRASSLLPVDALREE